MVRKASTPRSYNVQTPEGDEYQRNQSHLLKTEEPRNPGPEHEKIKLTPRVSSGMQNQIDFKNKRKIKQFK